jgi:hypothetical protein
MDGVYQLNERMNELLSRMENPETGNNVGGIAELRAKVQKNIFNLLGNI